MQGELKTISNAPLAAALKSEIVHFAVTDYESTLMIEPGTSAKNRELILQRSLDRVGSGGPRLVSAGNNEFLKPYSSTEARNQMRLLVNDFVHEHKGDELARLNDLSLPELNRWVEQKTIEAGKSADFAALHAELGGIEQISRDLKAEIGGYATNASRTIIRSAQEIDRQYERLALERSLSGVGQGGSRLTAEGVSERPTYSNPAATRDMKVMVAQFFAGTQLDRFSLPNLSEADVEKWFDSRKENRPGNLFAEFGNDKQAVVKELRAEFVHAGLDYYEQAMRTSNLPEPVFREIMQDAVDIRDRIEVLREAGKFDSVKDLPDVQKQMRNFSRDSIGRIDKPHYQFSIQEITARRVELRDTLHQEIWRTGVKSPLVQATIDREGRKSPAAQEAISEFGEHSEQAKKVIFEEGLRSHEARRELNHAGIKSGAAQDLIAQIKLDVKREMLDKALLSLEKDPANSDSLERAKELAAMIVDDLRDSKSLAGPGRDSVRFMVDMGLVSPSDSRARAFNLTRASESVSLFESGSLIYDMQPVPDFGLVEAARSDLRMALQGLRSSRSNPGRLETAAMLSEAGDLTFKLFTDSQLRIAQTLGLPAQFLTEENFKFQVLDGIEGMEVLGRGETIIGAGAENPVFTAIHEAGHAMRIRRLMALSEADPQGVRLALMDHCLDGIGRPGRIASAPETKDSERAQIRERHDFKSAEAADLFKEHVRSRITESLKEFQTGEKSSATPGRDFEPDLLREFSGSKEALDQALRFELENFKRLSSLVDTSNLNQSSYQMVQFLRDGPAGQVVHLAAHNLVERTGLPVDPVRDMAEIQKEIALLTQSKPGDLNSSLSASEQFIAKVLQDNPVDLDKRELLKGISEIASQSQARVRQALSGRPLSDLLL
ncbi:MAG: hypothetical protein K8F91_06750, partial [Candidatus Obscuribacterales bacterium]|nr:hypothetical protein [Candidatus Obscuribacterales bacterium]